MIHAVISVLTFIARYGRFGLVVGLIAGIMMPALAQLLKPWLPQLVMGLLFLVALRIGPDKARSGLSHTRSTFGIVLLLQMALPLGVIVIAYALDIAHSSYVLATALVFAAPALAGSPSLATLLNADPEPAFRMLIVGTCLLPLTIIPVFWALPQFGDFQSAILSALRTLAAMFVALSCGLLARFYFARKPSEKATQAMDGAMTVALVVIVVGLMAGLRPALDQSLQTVATWMALAFAINIGAQVTSYFIAGKSLPPADRVPVSIVAGNRNVAIFLVALSAETAEPLLIFLGCYQVPMYLTPILMRRLYGGA